MNDQESSTGTLCRNGCIAQGDLDLGVVDGRGEVVSEGTVISEPAAIAAFIEARAGCALRIGLETGPTTTWLWHELGALGLPVICIDARHAEAALSLQINKSDGDDASGPGPDHAVRLV